MSTPQHYTMAMAALMLILSSTTATAEDVRINRLLAAQCAQCHGTEGKAVGDMDSLAGDQDLLEDLLDMLSEDHIEDIMEHQAQGYRSDQIRRIADYYAGLPESGGEEEEEHER